MAKFIECKTVGSLRPMVLNVNNIDAVFPMEEGCHIITVANEYAVTNSYESIKTSLESSFEGIYREYWLKDQDENS